MTSSTTKPRSRAAKDTEVEAPAAEAPKKRAPAKPRADEGCRPRRLGPRPRRPRPAEGRSRRGREVELDDEVELVDVDRDEAETPVAGAATGKDSAEVRRRRRCGCRRRRRRRRRHEAVLQRAAAHRRDRHLVDRRRRRPGLLDDDHRRDRRPRQGLPEADRQGSAAERGRRGRAGDAHRGGPVRRREAVAHDRGREVEPARARPAVGRP